MICVMAGGDDVKVRSHGGGVWQICDRHLGDYVYVAIELLVRH